MNYIERKKINPNATMKSFPLLAIEQFERLILSHNVEFRGGFYMQGSGPNGESRELYIPDTREVFCNTCRALALLIVPKFTSRMKKQYEEIMEQLEHLKAEFLEATSVEETVVLGEGFYQKEEDKILLEQYNNAKVEIYQKLFEHLCQEFMTHRYWVKTSSDD